jgi:AbrB family looped-hinge helix DNA binding protein
MESAKLSSKSQITVPRKVRESLRIGRGDRICFEATPDGRYLIGKVAPIQKSDGAARRRLTSEVVRVPDLRRALVKAVREDDRRIRLGQ